MSLAERSWSVLSQRPDAVLYEGASARLRAGEVLREAELLASTLARAGLGAGSVVALALANGPAFPIACLALWRNRSTVVLISPKSGSEELSHILANARPDGLLAGPQLVRRAGPLLAEPREWLELFGQRFSILPASDHVAARDATICEAALIKYSSGSTGKPKGILLGEEQLLAEAENVLRTLELGPGDRILFSVPLTHSYGFDLALLPALLHGCCLVAQSSFAPRPTWRALADASTALFLGVPSMYRFLLEAAHEQHPTVRARRLLSCTAPLHPELIERFHATCGAVICQHYGSSETGGATLHDPEQALARADSVGRALHGVTIDVVDEAGRVLGIGEPGEVVIRSRAVARGYAPGHGLERNPFAAGSFRTGDLGRLDAQGYLYLQGRLDGMINVGGLKVSPAEVVRVLEDFQPVAEAAVLALQDAQGENFVGAAVRLQSPSSEAEILEHCRGRLESHKVPRRVEILERMPRGSSGKIKLSAEDFRR